MFLACVSDFSDFSNFRLQFPWVGRVLAAGPGLAWPPQDPGIPKVHFLFLAVPYSILIALILIKTCAFPVPDGPRPNLHDFVT